MDPAHPTRIVRWPRTLYPPDSSLPFPPMTIVVNGEPKQLPPGSSVADLVRALGLEKAACAVEVNRTLVPRARHPEQPLAEGDRVEVVTLVGGG